MEDELNNRSVVHVEEFDSEEEENDVPFHSQRAAVAEFNLRAENQEKRKMLAEEAVRQEKARRKNESMRGMIKILVSFGIGFLVLLLLWIFVQSRTHKKNEADSLKIHFYYSVTDENTITITSVDSLNVQSLEIPSEMNRKKVTGISANAFAGHVDMQSIKLPDTLEEIGYNAFQDCTSLTAITIPDSVETLSYCAFTGCKVLKDVHLSKNLTVIEYGMFGECFALEKIEIPEGITELGHGAFNRCTALREVALPGSLAKISGDTFRDCIALTGIQLPDSLTEIGSSAFSGCTSLKSITIPPQVNSIISFTFKNCQSMEEIHIPDSVTVISDKAFEGCSMLTIYGNPGSYAQSYAEQYGFPFAAQSDEPVESIDAE